MKAFHQEHRARYGYAQEQNSVEIVKYAFDWFGGGA
jgi:hypothetical protein